MHSQPPFKIDLINFLSIEETEARGAAVAYLKALRVVGSCLGSRSVSAEISFYTDLL